MQERNGEVNRETIKNPEKKTRIEDEVERNVEKVFLVRALETLKLISVTQLRWTWMQQQRSTMNKAKGINEKQIDKKAPKESWHWTRYLHDRWCRQKP